jgi:hypothetical protein
MRHWVMRNRVMRNRVMRHWVMRNRSARKSSPRRCVNSSLRTRRRCSRWVEEYGERDNARVYAWGIAFDNHVEVIGPSGGLRVTFNSVEHAQRKYSRRRKIRLVWANPAATRRSEPVG